MREHEPKSKRKRGAFGLMDVVALSSIAILFVLIALEVWTQVHIVIGGTCINC